MKRKTSRLKLEAPPQHSVEILPGRRACIARDPRGASLSYRDIMLVDYDAKTLRVCSYAGIPHDYREHAHAWLVELVDATAIPAQITGDK